MLSYMHDFNQEGGMEMPTGGHYLRAGTASAVLNTQGPSGGPGQTSTLLP